MVQKIKNIVLSKEFQKFFVVGGIAFLLDFGILTFEVYILNFQLTLFEVVFIPNVISATVAIVFGFFAQRQWAFKERNKDKAFKEMSKYILVQLFNLVVFNSIIFGIILNFGVIVPISKILVVGMQTITSYVLYKYFVFKNVK